MAQAPHHDGGPEAGDGWRLIAPRGVLDLGEAPPRRPLHDLDALARGLADRARDWVPRLFPAGRLVDGGWRLADVGGRAARKHGSCVIALAGADAGCWYDFALGRGGGPLDTYAHATGLSGRALFEAAAAEVGTGAPSGSVPTRSQARPRTCRARDPEDIAREIAFILSGCRPAAGTLAETYLASRALPCPAAPDLLFHPALTHYGSRAAWPAMVAVVRSAAGQPIGLHRTYLARDGSGKAPLPKPKMMLGDVLGGAVRLAPPHEGRLGVAEGIETAIAAAILFGMPVWATLSTAGMRAFVPLVRLTELGVFADAGVAGEAAAGDLLARLTAAGLAGRIERPLYGDDFAHDLASGRTPC